MNRIINTDFRMNVGRFSSTSISVHNNPSAATECIVHVREELYCLYKCTNCASINLQRIRINSSSYAKKEAEAKVEALSRSRKTLSRLKNYEKVGARAIYEAGISSACLHCGKKPYWAYSGMQKKKKDIDVGGIIGLIVVILLFTAFVLSALVNRYIILIAAFSLPASFIIYLLFLLFRLLVRRVIRALRQRKYLGAYPPLFTEDIDELDAQAKSLDVYKEIDVCSARDRIENERMRNEGFCGMILPSGSSKE